MSSRRLLSCMAASFTPDDQHAGDNAVFQSVVVLRKLPSSGIRPSGDNAVERIDSWLVCGP